MQVSAGHGEQGEAKEPPRMDRRVLGLWQEGEKFGNGSAGERASHGVSQCPFESSTEHGRGSAVMQVRLTYASLVIQFLVLQISTFCLYCMFFFFHPSIPKLGRLWPG